jgi:hypothetical protein
VREKSATLNQQGLAHGLGKRVSEAIADIQLRRMTAPPAEIALTTSRAAGNCAGDGAENHAIP